MPKDTTFKASEGFNDRAHEIYLMMLMLNLKSTNFPLSEAAIRLEKGLQLLEAK